MTTASQLSLAIPDLLIEASPASERLKLTLMEFSMLNEMYQVCPEADTISFSLKNVMSNQTASYLLPMGTYTLRELATLFSVVTNGLLHCSYLSPQNKMRFTLPAAASPPHELVVSDGLSKIVGLKAAPVTASSPTFSTRPCRPLATGTLFVKLDDHLPDAGSLVLSNMGGGQELKLDNTLAVVPLSDTPPWHYVSWTNRTPESGGLFAGDTKLSSIRLSITDEEGQPVWHLPDWWAVIKVDVVRTTEDRSHVDLLQKILQTLKDTLMFKYLGRS